VDIVDAGTFDWGQHRDRFFQFRANSETEGSGEISPWHTSGRRAFGIRAQFEVLRDIGSCLSAMSAHQLMLGLETLGLRCERHSYNTAALACWLAEQPQVTWVSYLGNPEHPSHERARRYLRHGFGSLLSFGIRGGKKAGFRLCDRLKIITSTAK
jgi:O-acetylhomoserine/O-acetylserine sulfhydrylase